MMRSRLLVSFGVMCGAIGLALANAALWWLSSQTDLPMGQPDKSISMSNLGLTVGTLILLGGVAAVVLGLAFRPRVEGAEGR